MLFFKSFLDNILNEKNIKNYNKKYHNNFFRSFIFENFKKNFNKINDNQIKLDNINTVSIFLKPFLNKPQRLLKDHDDYYIAIDMLTNTKYICFKEFCVLDFDINKNNYETKNDILYYINNNTILNDIPYYRVETERGYHLYLIDKPRNYSDIETFFFINQFDCDDFYKFYCFIRGFSIRLSFKSNDSYIFKNVKLINKTNKSTNGNESLILKNLFFTHFQFFDQK